MDHQRVAFRAAAVRVLLGLFSVLVLPMLYPRVEQHRRLFIAYFAFTLVIQLLIWKRVGGQPRSVVTGIVDLALLTFIVQRVGSLGTPLVSLYLFAGTINALVNGLRVGAFISSLGPIATAS